jgi:hypothetical protein
MNGFMYIIDLPTIRIGLSRPFRAYNFYGGISLTRAVGPG